MPAGRKSKIIQMGRLSARRESDDIAIEMERCLRAQCAAVLAGRAVGELAIFPSRDASDGMASGCSRHAGTRDDAGIPAMLAAASACKRKLQYEGVLVQTLSCHDCGILLYACRPELLMGCLGDARVRRVLEGLGYDTHTLGGCLACLRRRASCRGGDFPCEVGFFLGRPIEDATLLAFAGSTNSLCDGPWKHLVNAPATPEEQERRAREVIRQLEAFPPPPRCPIHLAMN